MWEFCKQIHIYLSKVQIRKKNKTTKGKSYFDTMLNCMLKVTAEIKQVSLTLQMPSKAVQVFSDEWMILSSVSNANRRE